MFLLEEGILREESNVINENEDRHLNRREMICRMQSISKIKNIIPKQTFKTAISFGDISYLFHSVFKTLDDLIFCIHLIIEALIND